MNSLIDGAVQRFLHDEADEVQALNSIKNLHKNRHGKICVQIEFELDFPKKDLEATRHFLMKHKKRLQNLVNRYIQVKTKVGIREIDRKEDKAVYSALRRLGIL